MGMKGWTQVAGGKKRSWQLRCSKAVSDTRTDHAAAVRKMEEDFSLLWEDQGIKITYVHTSRSEDQLQDGYTGTFKQLLLGLCIWLQNAWSKKAWQVFKTFYGALQKKKKCYVTENNFCDFWYVWGRPVMPLGNLMDGMKGTSLLF